MKDLQCILLFSLIAYPIRHISHLLYHSILFTGLPSSLGCQLHDGKDCICITNFCSFLFHLYLIKLLVLRLYRYFLRFYSWTTSKFFIFCKILHWSTLSALVSIFPTSPDLNFPRKFMVQPCHSSVIPIHIW